MKKILASLLALSIISISVSAKIELPSVIGSNMVLQQNADAALWGWASPDSKVTIKAGWQSQSIRVMAGSDGKWSAKVATPSAGGPYEISFSEGKDKVTISNVLIGEVWFCSGQSNMEMPVKGFTGQDVKGSTDLIASASKTTPIRMYTVERNAQETVQDRCTGEWRENTPEAVAKTSAVAYFFAQTIQNATDVPVGVIITDWGGTMIEQWMEGGNLYNGMVAPLEPFTFKGMIWYQGESNRNDAVKYSNDQPAYVAMMREKFQNPDAGFYYVQIAPFHYRGFDSYLAPVFQQMQLENQDRIPHCGMACIADIGEPYRIHPSMKKEVGQRLAWLALYNDYDKKAINPYSPRVTSVEYRDGKAFITFDAKEGLIPFRVKFEGFEIAGEDKVFHAADAYVMYETGRDYNVVCVSSEEVPAPVAVRYCFHDWSVSNLKSAYGIPVSPFRTDDWPVLRFDW